MPALIAKILLKICLLVCQSWLLIIQWSLIYCWRIYRFHVGSFNKCLLIPDRLRFTHMYLHLLHLTMVENATEAGNFETIFLNDGLMSCLYRVWHSEISNNDQNIWIYFSGIIKDVHYQTSIFKWYIQNISFDSVLLRACFFWKSTGVQMMTLNYELVLLLWAYWVAFVILPI